MADTKNKQPKLVAEYNHVDPYKVGNRRAPGTNEEYTVRKHGETPQSSKYPKPPNPQTPKTNYLPKILAVVALILVLLAYYYYPREHTAVLDKVQWSIRFDVQQFQENYYESFSVPVGARVVSQSVQVEYYDTVVDRIDRVCTVDYVDKTYSEYSHTETKCFDNGECIDKDVYVDRVEKEAVETCTDHEITHQEPVYGTLYSYYIWEWVNLDPLITSGINDLPVVPVFYEDQYNRVSSRTDTFEAIFQAGKQEYTRGLAGIQEYDLYLHEIGTAYLIETRGYSVSKVRKLR
eukprot:TRINITY_DN2909_c0_g1_i1.p1 TRINITY_DN2909_c0_g1~~TRINITY_DN2909_c0_g1_i1.p1  ORF type:complete len:291 (-),score=53.12 TRINITY_DN2909_c0_g1_i1:46-918(-)